MPTNRMRLANRRTVIKAGGAGAITGLAGCLGGGGDDQTLTWIDAYNQPQQIEFKENLVEEYNSEHDEYTLETETVEDVPETVSRIVRGGQSPPDLVYESDISGTAPLLEADLAEPVTDLLQELESGALGEIPDAFIPESGGEVWGIPLVVKPYHHVWRGDVLEEAGVSVADSMEERLENNDWDAMLERMSAVDENTDLEGFAFAYSQTQKGAMDGMHALWSNGAHMFRGEYPDNTEVTLDQGEDRERALEAIDFWVNEVTPRSVDGAESNWGHTTDAFIQGQAAGAIHTVGHMAAQLEAGEGGDPSWIDDIVVMPMPTETPRDDGVRARASPQHLHVLSGENQEAAKEFVRWFPSSDAYQFLLKEGRILHDTPPSVDVLQSDEYAEDNWLVQQRPDIIDDYVTLFESDTLFVPSMQVGGDINMAFTSAYNNGDYGELFQRIIQADEDPEEALDTVADQIREYLD